MKKTFLSFLLIIITVFIINEINSSKPILVDVVSPRNTTVYNSISAKGSIIQKNDNFIAINQNGIVDEVYFADFDAVKVGDLLLTIKVTNDFPDISKDNLSNLLNTKTTIILDTFGQEYIEIRSTTNGTILNIPSKNEQIIKSIPFLSISSNNSVIAVIDIPERYINRVQIGQTVNLTGASFNTTLRGEISEIKPYTKTSFDILNTNTEEKIESEVVISYFSDKLILGASVNAEIIVDKVYDALVLPYSAIFQEDRQEYVLKYVEGISVKTPIETRYELGSEIEVISGISEKDIIILDISIGEGKNISYE